MMKNINNGNRLDLKPSWLLIANSILVILLSVAFIYMGTHVLFSKSAGFMKLVGIIFLLIFIPLGILQFFATFKKSIVASYVLSTFWGIIGLWPVFLLSLRGGIPNASFIVKFLLVVSYIILTIVLTLRWANILKKQPIEL